MKKHLFLLSMIFATANIYSQSYQINFVGSGATTTLDSVKVENLTKGTSLTLIGTDDLHLKGTTGIYNLFANIETVTVYPSPMQGQSELSFYVKESGFTKIVIFDISGKTVLETSNNLLQGTNKYKIIGLNEGSFVISICGKKFHYSLKLISRNKLQPQPEIKYIGNEKYTVASFKDTKATIDMAFATGDNLRFTGYSGIYNDIKTDVPTSNKTITFNFVDLPEVTTDTVDFITNVSATCTGKARGTITSRGVCWSLTTTPTLTDNFTSDGTDTGIYKSFMQNLTSNTLYYVRVYATNSAGTVYGKILSFRTRLNLPVLSKLNTLNDYVANIHDTDVTIFNIKVTGDSIIDRGFSIGKKSDLSDAIQTSLTSDTIYKILTGLTPNTIYYVTAYATNGAGVTSISFTFRTTITIGTVYLGGTVIYVNANKVTGLIAGPEFKSPMNLQTGKDSIIIKLSPQWYLPDTTELKEYIDFLLSRNQYPQYTNDYEFWSSSTNSSNNYTVRYFGKYYIILKGKTQLNYICPMRKF